MYCNQRAFQGQAKQRKLVLLARPARCSTMQFLLSDAALIMHLMSVLSGSPVCATRTRAAIGYPCRQVQ